MSSILRVPFNGGYVSTGTGARDAADLETGELQEMAGGYYRKNDPLQVWTMPGRSLFGVAGSGTVKGLALCQFDAVSNDKLVASVGTTLVSATPGATGTFTSLVTGLSSSATRLASCHQNDRWYLGNGIDDNKVLMPDGTLRPMGMQPPTQAPTTSVSTAVVVTATEYPVTNYGSWDNPTYASDPDPNTFSSITVTPNAYNRDARSQQVIEQDYIPAMVHEWYGWPTSALLNRTLKVRWGATIPAQSVGRILIEASEDNGNLWTTMLSSTLNASASPSDVTMPITADSSAVRVRVTFGVEGNPCTAQMFLISISGIQATNASTADAGIYYATTEYYAPDLLESPPLSYEYWHGPLTFTDATAITVTKPPTTNSIATHWRVWRIVNGAAATPQNLASVSGLIPIATTTWVDTFEIPITQQGDMVIPLLEIGDLAFYRDSPPPPFLSIISWKGSVCGIPIEPSRSWYYSEAGRPESFPAPYVVESFPLDEHDTLVGQMAVGETLVLLCSGAVLALDDTPRVTDGVFNSASARPIKGHPGCVGNYAYTSWSVAGEPRGAWVSPFGVYVTNGQVCASISEDLAWEDEVNVPYLGSAVLRWDAKNLILWFEFDKDGDGLNDHEMPFHMSQAHEKSNGRPKLGQPTPKATSCMASGLIQSTHYRFSGHPSDGSVYVEEVGRVDASTGEAVTMSVRSGQVSRSKVTLGVIKATLNHSDFGTGEEGTLIATTYHDTSNWQDSVEQTVALNGNRGTTLGIGRAGELVDFTFEYDGTATGGIGGVTAEIDGMGRSGSAPRVTSNSATP